MPPGNWLRRPNVPTDVDDDEICVFQWNTAKYNAIKYGFDLNTMNGMIGAFAKKKTHYATIAECYTTFVSQM